MASDTEQIDYDRVMEIAMECKPKMIVCGASAYPRIIDFKRFREIADACGAYLMVDMAHIAGLGGRLGVQSQSGTLRSFCNHYHSQDSERPQRRHDLMQGGIRQAD